MQTTEMKSKTNKTTSELSGVVVNQWMKTLLKLACNKTNDTDGPALQRDVRDLLWAAPETAEIGKLYNNLSALIDPAGAREMADLRANALKSLHWCTKELCKIVPEALRSLFRDACWGSRSATGSTEKHIADLWGALSTFNGDELRSLAAGTYKNLEHGAWGAVKTLIVAEKDGAAIGLDAVLGIAQRTRATLTAICESKKTQMENDAVLKAQRKAELKAQQLAKQLADEVNGGGGGGDDDDDGGAKKKQAKPKKPAAEQPAKPAAKPKPAAAKPAKPKKPAEPKKPKKGRSLIDTYASLMRTPNQNTIKSKKSDTTPLSCSLVLLSHLQDIVAQALELAEARARDERAQVAHARLRRPADD